MFFAPTNEGFVKEHRYALSFGGHRKSCYAAAGVIALAENLFLHFVPARSPLRILMRMADLPIAAIVCAAVLLVAFKTGVIRPGIKRQKLPTTA